MNTPNKLYETVCGKKIWHSRSVAVAVTCFFTTNNKNKLIPVVRRGKIMEIEPGKLCLPCGYLDWDEDGGKAAIRELREETGIDYFSIKKEDVLYDCFLSQPWYVNSDPKSDELQNVTLYYGGYFHVKELPKVNTNFNDVNGEVSEILWINVKDLHKIKLNEFAFNHLNKIIEFDLFLSRRKIANTYNFFGQIY